MHLVSTTITPTVLILVVMEEGQRLPAKTAGTVVSTCVLILVVMEEGQRRLLLDYLQESEVRS